MLKNNTQGWIHTLFGRANNDLPLRVIICLFIIGKICLFNAGFFWDSVATLSKPSLFLYDNHFSSFNFPPNMVDDNLFLASVLASVWTIFGCNLIVTHVFFGIVGVALIFQLYRLCRFFVSNAQALPFVFILVVSDPALVTQSLLLMTDLFMVLFAVMSIRFLLENKRTAATVSLLFLSLLRARGVCMCAGIGAGYYLYLLYQQQGRKPLLLLKQAILPFVPAIVFFVGFFIFRKLTSGGYYYEREENPWSSGYKIVNFKHFVKNIATVGRCFLDYGRIFLWLVLGVLFFKFGKKRFFASSIHIPDLFLLGSLFCMLCVTLPFTNPMGFRYFILQYILVALITGILLFSLLKEKTAKIICTLLIIGLWSGNTWIYPEKISNGWDASLAHLPYYELRKDMLHYIDEQQIDYQDIASFFPAEDSEHNIDLRNDCRKFAHLDFKQNKYVIYSNTGNWSDESINEIHRWKQVKEFRKHGVFIRLYESESVSR